jgi:hypothetical protein
MLAVVIANVGNHRGMGVEYANRLRSDLMKHLAVPHRVYCFTDQAASFYPRTRCKPHPRGRWEMDRLFRPGQFKEERILYLSLDTILLKDIDELAGYEGEAAASAGGHVLLWRNGFAPGVWESLEDAFPGLIAPYQEYLPESARIVTFYTAPHEVGGWVSEYWEKEAA